MAGYAIRCVTWRSVIRFLVVERSPFIRDGRDASMEGDHTLDNGAWEELSNDVCSGGKKTLVVLTRIGKVAIGVNASIETSVLDVSETIGGWDDVNISSGNQKGKPSPLLLVHLHLPQHLTCWGIARQFTSCRPNEQLRGKERRKRTLMSV